MTASIKDLTEAFAADNEHLVSGTRDLFSEFCSSPGTAWLLLNTLSYMEHIGSYKIMATQSGQDVDYQTLKHIHEEASHAALFKRHAERIAGARLDYSDAALMASASARMYFAKLEATMASMFRTTMNSRTVYLYMSLIVEFRAIWAYPMLQQAADEAGLQVSLSKLLAEEHGHLHSMARRLEADESFSGSDVHVLCGHERKRFERLLHAMQEFRGSRLQAA